MVATETQSFYREFGRLVRQHRQRLGFTQERLGNQVGLSRTSVTNIEKGRQHVALDQVYLLASALGTPVTTLLPRLAREDRASWIASRLPEGTEQGVADWVNQFVDDE